MCEAFDSGEQKVKNLKEQKQEMFVTLGRGGSFAEERRFSGH